MDNLLIGLGTMMIGFGTILTAVVSLRTLRTTRSVKTDIAENTAMTKEVHAAVTDPK
jgi:hypothetical protein